MRWLVAMEGTTMGEDVVPVERMMQVGGRRGLQEHCQQQQ